MHEMLKVIQCCIKADKQLLIKIIKVVMFERQSDLQKATISSKMTEIYKLVHEKNYTMLY